jgi:hypothetical protein
MAKWDKITVPNTTGNLRKFESTFHNGHTCQGAKVKAVSKYDMAKWDTITVPNTTRNMRKFVGQKPMKLYKNRQV